MLHINDLVYRIAGRTLFDKATLAVAEGQRIGLIGRNGTGKSTLLKLILSEISPDGGSVTVRPGARVEAVAQEAPAGSDSVLETVLAADRERASLLARAETATDGHEIAEIHTRLADIDAHSAPARAAAILAGLGFDADAQTRPCDSYSGGWRMRVALARALFTRPELLLLDEPTNHLDLEATIWLEQYLASYPGTLIVVSHDRDLLNKVVNRIVHLDQGKLVAYKGGFDSFERQRRERHELQAKAHAKQMAEREKMEAFIARFRAKATKARQAQSRIKALERMEPIEPVTSEKRIEFSFPNPDALAPPLLTLEKAAVGYEPGHPVLRDLNLRIDMDDRIALLGANGNGKSTLVKLLAGRLDPEQGTVAKSGKLKVAYFAQHQMEELRPRQTAFEHIQDMLPDEQPAKLRAQLGRFGLGQEKADVAVENLSGGEKARLLFALMSREKPHLMLLDEPTNHLDIDTREALVEAINAFEGAVIFISHDRHMVELCADRLWLVADGTCKPYDGDLSDYRRLLLEKRAANRDDGGEGAGGGQGARLSKKEQRREAARNREALAPLRKTLKAAEKKLEQLTRERDEVAAALADPKLYDGPAEEIANLNQRQKRIEEAIGEAEEAWLAAAEAMDAADA